MGFLLARELLAISLKKGGEKMKLYDVKRECEVSKLNEYPGTLVCVNWPDVTSWCRCGWFLVTSLENKAVLRREEK